MVPRVLRNRFWSGFCRRLLHISAGELNSILAGRIRGKRHSPLKIFELLARATENFRIAQQAFHLYARAEAGELRSPFARISGAASCRLQSSASPAEVAESALRTDTQLTLF